jgi:hypothetical protein
MTERKINIGIIQTYVLVLIQVLFALTFLFDFMAENYDDKKDLIYQIAYVYVYVSILTLIKKLVIDNLVIVKYLNWIIKLEIFKALTSILVAAGIYQVGFFTFLFGLILLILYIILIFNILNKKYNDNKEIIGLRPFVIALIFGFITSLIGGIYAEYNHGFEIYGVIYLIMVIPYIFIISYLNKMKMNININKMPTANTQYSQ